VEGFARMRQSTQPIGAEATREVLVSHTDHMHMPGWSKSEKSSGPLLGLIVMSH
jgi:hypothetical protein